VSASTAATDHTHPRQPEEADQITGAVGGAVIDDYHLELRVARGGEGADRLLDAGRLVVRGNHD
jgi:hypothetical protein